LLLVAAMAGLGAAPGQLALDPPRGPIFAAGTRVGEAAGCTGNLRRCGGAQEEIAAPHVPEETDSEGVFFLVVVGRAPATVWHVERMKDGRIHHIERKRPWVNHYAFHIRGRPWGHMIIRFCPHSPFNALIILNGHEWVATEAARRGSDFRK
jgi:hypothetical protein